jgi:hypothetical protein
MNGGYDYDDEPGGHLDILPRLKSWEDVKKMKPNKNLTITPMDTGNNVAILTDGDVNNI